MVYQHYKWTIHKRTEIQQDNQSIITANRFEVLSNLKEPEFKKVTRQQTSGKIRRKKDNLQNPRNKILFLGDSHVREMAAKLQHNLDVEYSVQGLVKPGADLATILTSIEIESKRDSFTKHWLHMNSRGKEQIVKGIVIEILDMWREKKSDPIIMKGKDEQELEEEGTHIPLRNGPLKTGGKRSGQPRNIEGLIVTELDNTHDKRNRRKPSNRSSDFLWEG
ncbi:hypothetical protein B7P43_G18373 [Cryptotermes secundus]|uniref:Uncharacterized protein n=1 Tax=Cryptotermes secundus TaxID=105785 RepID=A0A2J7RNL5_9NEOP|nr:hypothetical protein B7P43_G18373 [Cryptotermes secundus]